LNKYRPETAEAKKQRLNTVAAAKAKNETVDLKKPLAVLSGLNAVVRAVEQKKAKLVVLAHDVDPIEVIRLYQF
jgi:large subunit ribosomal protein L7Ae